MCMYIYIRIYFGVAVCIFSGRGSAHDIYRCEGVYMYISVHIYIYIYTH